MNKPRASSIDVSYSDPKRYEIAGITVSGVQFLDANALIALSGLKVGDEITIPGERISLAIKKLWDQGILGDVQINITKVEGRLVHLELALKERPRLSKFTFRGVKKGEANDLREKINLIRGRVVTDALIKNTSNTIRKYFVEKGFLNAKVDIFQEVDTSAKANTTTLRIAVRKNERVKVNSITFEGNTQYTSEQLRRKLSDTKEKRIWRLFKISKFIQSNYDKDKASLIEFYNKNGYRDAAIEFDTVAKVDNKGVNIRIRLEEGPKYHFGNIDWVGNFVYPDETLSKVLGVNRGDVYNPENLEKRLKFNMTGQDITSLYMDDGYLFFNVDPVEVGVRGDTIDLEMRLFEGSQATISKVSVSGNTKTNDHVINREIRTLPGQKFSRADLMRTQRELLSLGYFDPEGFDISPVPNPSTGTVDINYKVTERPSDQIELSGGWGGFFGFVGTAGVTFNNFSLRRFGDRQSWTPLPSGDGQRLSLRIQANGRQFQTYSASFTEPWLGGKRPNSLTVSASHSVQGSFAFNQGNSSRLQVTGLSVSLGRRLRWPDDYFTFIQGLSVQRYLLNQYFIIPGSTFGNGTSTNFNYNMTLARNSVNQPTFPTAGSSLSLTATFTPPYSLMGRQIDYEDDASRFKFVEYHKWMFDASWFTPLAKNLVLNTRAHMGFMGTYNNRLGYGPFERFRLGGDGITGFNFLLGYDIIGLRGYTNNSIVPQQGVAAGIVYNKWVSELRYAISTNQAATIWVHTFLEAGNNWGNYRDYNPFTVYRSTGFGARIFMPAFGLIGVDWGIPFDPQPGNSAVGPGQFHFTIGQQIR